MDRTFLHEHDANQGAQSRGEFLGMTGNSGWYLLGSIGVSLLLTILCWGIFGISLLLCLLVGVVLCGMSVAYVFALKNNRPEHYDTDFFESVLIEAGVMELAFGPRARRIANPFVAEPVVAPARGARAPAPKVAPRQPAPTAARRHAPADTVSRTPATPVAEVKREVRKITEPVVPLATYEHVREELDAAEDLLEDVLSERAEG